MVQAKSLRYHSDAIRIDSKMCRDIIVQMVGPLGYFRGNMCTAGRAQLIYVCERQFCDTCLALNMSNQHSIGFRGLSSDDSRQ